MSLQKYVIKCWSDLRNEYAPTLHGEFDSPSQARDYGRKHIKTLEFIVEAK